MNGSASEFEFRRLVGFAWAVASHARSRTSIGRLALELTVAGHSREATSVSARADSGSRLAQYWQRKTPSVKIRAQVAGVASPRSEGLPFSRAIDRCRQERQAGSQNHDLALVHSHSTLKCERPRLIGRYFDIDGLIERQRFGQTQLGKCHLGSARLIGGSSESKRKLLSFRHFDVTRGEAILVDADRRDASTDGDFARGALFASLVAFAVMRGRLAAGIAGCENGEEREFGREGVSHADPSGWWIQSIRPQRDGRDADRTKRHMPPKEPALQPVVLRG